MIAKVELHLRSGWIDEEWIVFRLIVVKSLCWCIIKARPYAWLQQELDTLEYKKSKIEIRHRLRAILSKAQLSHADLNVLFGYLSTVHMESEEIEWRESEIYVSHEQEREDV